MLPVPFALTQILLSEYPHMPARFFAIGVTHQLRVARHLMLEASHERGARGQIHPTLAVEHGGDGLLRLRLDVAQV